MSFVENGLKIALPIVLGFAGVRGGVGYVKGEMGIGSETPVVANSPNLEVQMLNNDQHIYVQVKGPFDPFAACQVIAESPSAAHVDQTGCLSSMATLQGGSVEATRGYTAGVMSEMTSLPLGSDGQVHSVRLDDAIRALNVGAGGAIETKAVDIDKFTLEERYLSVFLAGLLGLGGRTIRDSRRRSKSNKPKEDGFLGGLEAGVQLGVASVFPLGGIITIAAVEAFLTYRTMKQGGRYDGIQDPHSGIARYSQKDFKKGQETYHTKDSLEARSEEQASLDEHRQAVLGLLDSYDVMGRIPDRPPLFQVTLHQKDREFVDELVKIRRTEGHGFVASFIAFFQRQQNKEYRNSYSQKWHYDRRVGVDGNTQVDSRLDHPFFPSRDNLKSKLEKYREEQEALKNPKK